MVASSLPQVHGARAHQQNVSCSAQAASKRSSKGTVHPAGKDRKSQKESKLSPAVIARRAAAAALGTKQAEKLDKRRAGLAMTEDDASDTTPLPKSNYITALLTLLPAPDEDSSGSKKGRGRGRGKRREYQM